MSDVVRLSTTRPRSNRCRNWLPRPSITGTCRAARNFISIVILPTDGTALPNGRNWNFGTSPIYRQLSNKPLFALINLHGVPNANHNGRSRI